MHELLDKRVPINTQIQEELWQIHDQRSFEEY